VAGRSPIRRVFDTAERTVGAPLERATHSERFADAVAVATALRAAGRGLYQRFTADALHRANLPAWSDLAKVSRQIARLERRLADLTHELERTREPVEDGQTEPPAVAAH
jgi:hypothetical protein